MSRLIGWAVDVPEVVVFDSRRAAQVGGELARHGIAFERRPPGPGLRDLDDEAIFAANAHAVDEMRRASGFVSIDIARLHEDTPATRELRGRFLEEHVHEDDEVRWILDGAGVFWLRMDGRVFALCCEAGDVVSIPAGTPHAFDAVTLPMTAMRFFRVPGGWTARPTGRALAQVFPIPEEVR